MIKGIIIAFFCFLLFLLHVLIFHHFNIKRRFYFIFRVFFCAGLIYAGLFILIPESEVQKFLISIMPLSIFAFLNGAVLHFFFYHFYIHLIQVIDRSPSTRIMIEIENSKDKRLSLNQIKKLYSIDRKISNVLQDLVALRSIAKESDFYTITTKGKRDMRIFQFVRDYLKLTRN